MNIKDIRTRKGLTQAEVASALGVSSVVYSRYETGSRQPSIDILIQLADIFGVTVDYLLGRQDIEDSTLSERKQPSFQSLLNLLISHNRSKRGFCLNRYIPINSCYFSRDWSINWCKWCRSFFHRLRNIPYSSDTLLYSLLKYESRPSNSDCLSSFVTSV